MSTPTKETFSELAGWISKQPVWLRYAAADLLAGKAVGEEEIIGFAKLALSEVAGNLPPVEASLHLASLGALSNSAVSLVSLSKISGIGQLNPRNPLNFGTEKIAVVFGSNGSGKSSYVRILKHACGARHTGEILPNVFDGTETPQGCTITFLDDAGEHAVQWSSNSGVTPGLSTIDIFDTHCGDSYLLSEGTQRYEPRLLVFLSGLATLCDQVDAKLGAAIAAKVKALPALPPEHSATTGGKWYGAPTAQTDQAAVNENCAWTDGDEEELANLAKYLAERSPKDRARELETKKGFVLGLASSLNEHLAAVSDDACRALMTLRKTAIEKQKTAELAAKVNLKDAVLDGVGTEQWLALWSLARTYSAKVVYPDIPFPNIAEGSRCVLCQQELSPEATQRLQSFEQYVANEAATAAKVAKGSLEAAVEALPSLPDDGTLDAKATSAGLDEAATKSLKDFYTQLLARRALLFGEKVVEEFGAYPDTAKWIAATQALADGYATQAKQFLEGFNEKERAGKASRQKEISARKWIHEQKAAVAAEIVHLGHVAALDKAKDLCSTRAISFKKSALAEELITPAYIKAFNSELKRLGARNVKVELIKTRVERGAALHQVKLLKAVRNKPIQDVLSEGEHRIVCIAAFLADVASKPNGSTFVFDDPISSLDLDYEEAVVRRLVELSATRQVLVFTHRLSLLGMIEDYAEKAEIPIRRIYVRSEFWGAGEPGDAAIEAARPKAGLNEHLPKRIAAAKIVLENEGEAAYRVHAQSICTETRKLIERMIEWDLLADVIQRHRRAIKTLGKLDKLADIQPEDCTFLDEMMTKYSRYEHAQSLEAPVELPTPDELSEDVAKLKKWRDGLDARRNPKK